MYQAILKCHLSHSHCLIVTWTEILWPQPRPIESSIVMRPKKLCLHLQRFSEAFRLQAQLLKPLVFFFNWKIIACFLERKLWLNRDRVLKSKDITLLTKVHIVIAMVFPVVMYHVWMWELDRKKAEHQRIDAFELWCWGQLLRVLGLQGDQVRQSRRKSTLNIHWKDWCWSSNTLASWCKELTRWKKTVMLGKTESKRGRGWQRMR